jgi:hypothetical protein
VKRKPPSRWRMLGSILFVFLLLYAFALIQAPYRLHGRMEFLPYYMVASAILVMGVMLVEYGLMIRKRRLWIEDRRARGLPTYEQPRDAISNNKIVRRILFLPRQNSN